MDADEIPVGHDKQALCPGRKMAVGERCTQGGHFGRINEQDLSRRPVQLYELHIGQQETHQRRYGRSFYAALPR